ncbi:MAG: hypothetical protein AABZ14_01505 [Candidatus Margulisiibacteriota bacterium]
MNPTILDLDQHFSHPDSPGGTKVSLKQEEIVLVDQDPLSLFAMELVHNQRPSQQKNTQREENIFRENLIEFSVTLHGVAIVSNPGKSAYGLVSLNKLQYIF